MNNCTVPLGFLPWEIRVVFSSGKASCDRVALPNLRCMPGVLVCPQSTELWHVRTRKIVCTKNWLWEKKSLAAPGIEPVSAACRSDALPTQLHPCPSSVKTRQRIERANTALKNRWISEWSLLTMSLPYQFSACIPQCNIRHLKCPATADWTAWKIFHLVASI